MSGSHRRAPITPGHGINLVERSNPSLPARGRHALGSHPALVPAAVHVVGSDITTLLPAIIPAADPAPAPEPAPAPAADQPAPDPEVRPGWLTRLRTWITQ